MYKVYKDTTLMRMTKSELIKQLRVAQHNYLATKQALANSAKAILENRAKWIITQQVPEFSTYRCSKCSRQIVVKDAKHLKEYPYCHCGAFMENSNG